METIALGLGFAIPSPINTKDMYRFVANSMLIFVVTLPSGLVKSVEFERCSNNAYSYLTDNKQVADCIRKHPLTKAGRIIDESEPEPEAMPKNALDEVIEKTMDLMDDNALRFENITKAKNYLQKTYKVDVRKLKSPEQVKEKAKEHDEQNDVFADDTDEEMKQAIETAAQQLLLQAPPQMLQPKRVVASLNESGKQDYDAIQTQYTDGHGSLVIPDDWLRLVELRLKSWSSSLVALMDPGSKEAQMQASRWTRGTPQKPKGMITVSPTTGKRVLMYWTAGRYSANHDTPTNKVYDHEVELFTYLPYQKVKDVFEEDGKTVKDQEIILALTDECKKYLIYRAISIFLISKKESELGEKYNQLSQI